MPAKDPRVRIENARTAAYWSWAATPDRSARTAAARRAFEDRFERLVDPDLEMTPAARSAAAAAARTAHFRDMARRSRKARQAKNRPDRHRGRAARPPDSTAPAA